MALIRHLLSGLLLATLPGALAAQPAHGAGYTMLMTTDSGGRKTTVSTLVEVLGSRVRMGAKFGSRGGGALDMYTIIDTAAGTFTTVMPALSTVHVASAAMLADAGSASDPLDMADNPTSDVFDLGIGEPILGHATHHYRQTVTYVRKWTVGGETCAWPATEVEELWVTTEAGVPDMTAFLRRVVPAAGRSLFERKLAVLKSAKIKGVVLRRIGHTSMPATGRNAIDVRLTWEWTELSPGSVDAKDFEWPSGYKVTDDRAMMAKMDPAVAKRARATVQARRLESMKKTLCGKGGS